MNIGARLNKREGQDHILPIIECVARPNREKRGKFPDFAKREKEREKKRGRRSKEIQGFFQGAYA